LIALGRRLPPTKAGKRTASFIRSAMRRLRSEPLDLDVIGQKMRLYAGNNACEKRLIVTPQFFDPLELGFLKARLHPTFTFLDIGSNVGAYSIFVAKNAGPGARVVAVDPNAIVLKRLAFNAAANGLSNIRQVQAAIADADGEMEFALEESNMGGSSLQLDREARVSWPKLASTAWTPSRSMWRDLKTRCSFPISRRCRAAFILRPSCWRPTSTAGTGI
jgi:SAM-dependent methyltransferase